MEDTPKYLNEDTHDPQEFRNHLPTLINDLINCAVDYQDKDLLTVKRCLDNATIIKNVSRVEKLRVNLYATNHKLYQSLTEFGHKTEDIFLNRFRYFPTLDSYSLESLMDDMIPILNFLRDFRAGVINNFNMSLIFTQYKIHDSISLTQAIETYLKEHYLFSHHTKFNVVLDIHNDYVLNRQIRDCHRVNRNSYKSKLNLINSCNRSLIFTIDINNHNILMNFPTISNSYK
ncbi:ORF7 [Jasmine virus A-1]|nr:ORF7 [Jasmine virus A-1]